jgi:hypothetical protein
MASPEQELIDALSDALWPRNLARHKAAQIVDNIRRMVTEEVRRTVTEEVDVAVRAHVENEPHIYPDGTRL